MVSTVASSYAHILLLILLSLIITSNSENNMRLLTGGVGVCGHNFTKRCGNNFS